MRNGWRIGFHLYQKSIEQYNFRGTKPRSDINSNLVKIMCDKNIILNTECDIYLVAEELWNCLKSIYGSSIILRRGRNKEIRAYSKDRMPEIEFIIKNQKDIDNMNLKRIKNRLYNKLKKHDTKDVYELLHPYNQIQLLNSHKSPKIPKFNRTLTTEGSRRTKQRKRMSCHDDESHGNRMGINSDTYFEINEHKDNKELAILKGIKKDTIPLSKFCSSFIKQNEINNKNQL